MAEQQLVLKSTPETSPLTKVREIITIAMLIVLTGVLAYGFVLLKKVTTTITEVNNTLTKTDSLLVDSQKRLDDLSYHANAILIETGLTAMQVRKSSIQEVAQLNEFSTDLNVLVGKVSDTTDTANNTLRSIQENVNTIGNTTNREIGNIEPILSQARVTLATANDAIISTNIAIGDLDKTVNSTNAVITDPHIKETIANVDDTMTHVSSSTAKIDHQIDILTKPKRLIVRIFNGLLGTAAKVAVIVK